MKLEKIITLSSMILILAGAGATFNVTDTNSAHASQINRLISQRNNDYRQIKRLNAEIKQLSHRSKKLTLNHAYSLAKQAGIKLNKRAFKYGLNDKHTPNIKSSRDLRKSSWKQSWTAGYATTATIKYHTHGYKGLVKELEQEMQGLHLGQYGK